MTAEEEAQRKARTEEEARQREVGKRQKALKEEDLKEEQNQRGNGRAKAREMAKSIFENDDILLRI